MVKGLSRRVIVVDSPDPHIFEQAIFIVRNDAAVGSGGVTSQQVVDQAIRIAKDYARSHGAPPSLFVPALSPMDGKPANPHCLRWKGKLPAGSAIFRSFQLLCMKPEILYQNFHNFLLRIFSVYDKILDESFNETGSIENLQQSKEEERNEPPN